MKQSLSPFQEQCEEKLSAALSAQGHHLIERVLAGKNETFIQAKVAGTDLEVYIYSDEAQFHKASILVSHFESPDYACCKMGR
jgi:hypothetical protein